MHLAFESRQLRVSPSAVRLKHLIRGWIRARLFQGRPFVDEVFRPELVYAQLRRNGISIEHAIDVGANTGQWAQLFLAHYPQASLLSVEANPHNLPELKKVNPHCLQACLAAHPGELRTFYLPNPAVEPVNTGASLYRELQPGYDDPVPLILETNTLDRIGTGFDLIKLDVQGAELDVLRGGVEAVRSARIIMVEVSLAQYNDGAPLSAEVIAYLHERGFFLLAINEILFRHGRPIQLDLCFACSDLHRLAALSS